MVTVTIELGHKADCLDVATPEGFTHDWTVFVRGRGQGLDQFVEKVVFRLHKTFKMPIRSNKIMSNFPYIYLSYFIYVKLEFVFLPMSVFFGDFSVLHVLPN